MADDDKTLRDNMRPKKKKNTKKKTAKKKKFPAKYLKGSKNPKLREKLMRQAAKIYEEEPQPYYEAVKEKLKKIMKKRDKI